MYNIPDSGQISFRLKADEKEQLQTISDQLQEENETEFSNSKEIVFALIEKVRSLESDYKASELNFEATNKVLEETEAKLNDVVFDDSLTPLFDQIKEKLYGEDDPAPETNELILGDVLEVLNQPDPTPQTITKEVEKIVERELSPDELILKLSEKQIELLKLIANWRFSKKLDAEKRTPAQVIEGITFNKPALLNWGEGFRTGIKRKNLG